MKNVKFNPWIGSAYRQAPLGKRILILGESHYDWDADNPIDRDAETTIKVLQDQMGYNKAFWTNIVMTFLAHKPTLEEKVSFWDSVAFYQFIQSSVGFGPRKRPSEEQWAAGETPFFEVLGFLQPQLVAVLGYKNFEKLPNRNAEGGPAIPNFPDVETCRYSYSGGSSLAIRLKHPSSGYSSSYWHGPVSQAIRIA